MTNNSPNGGWFMISGMDLGKDNRTASLVEVVASSTASGKLEIWLDDLTTGKLIATIQIGASGADNWKNFRKSVKTIFGCHDVFVKFPAGSKEMMHIKSIRFLRAKYG